MTGRLVHSGPVVLDLVMRVSGLPVPGGDVLATSTELSPGGGYNVMVAAARSGAEVTYAGRHGDGRFGDVVRDALATAGIAVALAPSTGRDTGVCVVLVHDDGERTFVTGHGAELDLDVGALATVPVTPHDVVYVTGYSLLDERSGLDLAGWVRETGARPLVDPGPLVRAVPRAVWDRLLPATSVLSCNADEARGLSDTDDLEAAAAALAPRIRPDGAVVVRDGAAGCLVRRTGTTTVVPGIAVAAIDTTGAGDAHCGVLAAELLRGTDLVDAARRANAAAAIAVTRPGPATAPLRTEIDALRVSG